MKLDTYLRLPLSKRLAMFQATKTACAFYTHADGRRQLTPICRPDRNAHFKIGSTVCVWDESPELRNAGFADEVVNLRHKGWFVSEEFQDEVARGVVFLLPHGKFLAGIADPFNDGPHMLALETYSSKEDAARAADHIAEVYAGDCRDSDREARLELETQEALQEESERAYWEARDTVTI